MSRLHRRFRTRRFHYPANPGATRVPLRFFPHPWQGPSAKCPNGAFRPETPPVAPVKDVRSDPVHEGTFHPRQRRCPHSFRRFFLPFYGEPDQLLFVIAADTIERHLVPDSGFGIHDVQVLPEVEEKAPFVPGLVDGHRGGAAFRFGPHIPKWSRPLHAVQR